MIFYTCKISKVCSTKNGEINKDGRLQRDKKREKQRKLQNNGEGSCQNDSYPANLRNSLS